MRLVDEIRVTHAGTDRVIRLLIGDLSAIPPDHAVDLLVVSAFPYDYTPTPTSLIGALDRRGVSVERLAYDVAADLRKFSGCWLSTDIQVPGVGFRRILCFEPSTRGRAPEVVGDIFRSLIPVTTGDAPVAIQSVAMPIVASGDRGEPREVMLASLLEAATHWLQAGLPLTRIDIVAHTDRDEGLLRSAVGTYRAKHVSRTAPTTGAEEWRYDLFVSYSHKDKAAVDAMTEEVRRVKPAARVFVDRMVLQPGSAWQSDIFEAIDASRKVVAVLSPSYLASKVCKEEYNIALFRHRESNGGVLHPVYLLSAPMPTYMKLVQYVDVREADSVKVASAAQQLAQFL